MSACAPYIAPVGKGGGWYDVRCPEHPRFGPTIRGLRMARLVGDAHVQHPTSRLEGADWLLAHAHVEPTAWPVR